MLLEAIVKCYLRVSIKALIYITQSVIALIRIEPHTISDESRVGRSKDYNYMIFIEKGEASRARALERPIMSEGLIGRWAVTQRKLTGFSDGVG